ncbi:ribonuclease P protein component [Gammaproteobacteria bacterium 42_54_T18]|nr:ribonuclease P protein component [Gammaproteobacteria bacterium 42_54_T18]
MDFTFKKAQKLLTSKDFKSVFDHVHIKAGTGELLVLVFDNQDERPARLGLVVAKKNLKRAVDRNRFKRTIRESFRTHQHQLKGLDFVVLSRRGALTLDGPALKRVVDQTWRRILKKRAANIATRDS